MLLSKGGKKKKTMMYLLLSPLSLLLNLKSSKYITISICYAKSLILPNTEARFFNNYNYRKGIYYFYFTNFTILYKVSSYIKKEYITYGMLF